MCRRLAMSVALLLAVVTFAAAAKKPAAETKSPEEKKAGLGSEVFAGLELRGIGPALTSGRIIDIAVDPRNRKRFFVAAASGGVWRTDNGGTTWKPVFDAQGSYSIGCITLDPNDPLVVWVGTGENNSQRSVSYGDGVYRSIDGGTTWENMGLKSSEHIGRIAVDPRDSNVVYVAAQGPLWNAGGERGLYKTTDGGKTWNAVLTVSENTGVNEVLLDPRNPDVLYATSYQRRRHVWTVINGGPESAIHKSTDGGKSWRKLSNGLPGGDLGRIGLAISPVDPDVVYAIVEAGEKDRGFYRSLDAGSNWEKRSGYASGSGQYYQEIFADPRKLDRVYSMDTWMMVTEDGGKTFARVGERSKHVDNHVLWIDPADTDYLLAGCDGGVYESFDRGATWVFVANLPVTQFYKAAVDNDLPFYHVYGGTQDNFTLGGPVRNASGNGITNADWGVVVGGDGFQPQVDPEDPDIIYGEPQYGNLVRFDRASGEVIDIQPQPGKGEEALRWNWDSPLIISPHSHTRLYFAANRLFRSDDRGDTWRAVSPDLTRQIDRNRLPVMGRVWSVDAVAKNASTSFYGNIVALSESPQVEGLVYAGTDDGLVQVSEDGGASWRRIDRFPGVPEKTYVSRVEAAQNDADTVFAAFDNHKNGDFKPYVLKSTDRGRTWTSIAGDLPERGTVYALAQDGVRADLLFAGTEFGVYFTPDGGRRWIELTGGMPTIAVRDLVIQRRENDLVAATFGRGFYVLDDYTPLRSVEPGSDELATGLFPVRDAWMYMPTLRLGLRDRSFQGDSYYSAPNPPFGAVFTYYLKEGLQSLREARQEREKKAAEKGEDVFYPSWEDLQAEDREDEPAILLVVKDEEGRVVRRLTGPTGKGFHRVAWDLRFPPPDPASLEPPSQDDPFRDPQMGPLAAPGSYTVTLAQRVGTQVTELGAPVGFTATPLGLAKLPAADHEAVLAFQQKTAALQRSVLGAVEVTGEAKNRLALVKKALLDTPGAELGLVREAQTLEGQLADLLSQLQGDPVKGSRNEPVPPSIAERVGRVIGGQWMSSSAPTATQRDAYAVAAAEFGPVLDQLRTLIEVDLARLEDKLEEAGGPWTPGRVPRWNP